MICTEKEAAEKWCPQAREWGFDGSALNRESGNIPASSCYCIGSRCMLWVWVDDEQEIRRISFGGGHPNYSEEPAAPEGDGWIKGDVVMVSGYHKCRIYTRPYGERRVGTCGLIRSGE